MAIRKLKILLSILFNHSSIPLSLLQKGQNPNPLTTRLNPLAPCAGAAYAAVMAFWITTSSDFPEALVAAKDGDLCLLKGLTTLHLPRSRFLTIHLCIFRLIWSAAQVFLGSSMLFSFDLLANLGRDVHFGAIGSTGFAMIIQSHQLSVLIVVFRCKAKKKV